MSNTINNNAGIGSSNGSTNLQLLTRSPNKLPGQDPATVSEDGLQVSAPLAIALQIQAAVNSVNGLSQAFEQAISTGMTVDPTTGEREISASAASQLSASLNYFLQQNGFNQQQAEAATTEFIGDLAKGGPVDLSGSFDSSTAAGTSISSIYASQTVSASTISVTERAGSVSIEFDPDTGKISISLIEQLDSIYSSSVDLSVADELPLPTAAVPSDALATSSAKDDGSNDGESTTLRNTVSQTGPSTAPTNALTKLISKLGQPTLSVAQQAIGFSSDKFQLGARSSVPTWIKDQANTPAGSGQTALPAVSTPITIAFRQPLSASLIDSKGHGATFFRRVDGGTGVVTFVPTHFQA